MHDDPHIGRLLNGRFHVEETLGSGGYGVVYRATDIETNEQVALKLLRPNIANDHRIVARFRREGAVLFRLRSPHTVALYEFAYTAEGELYLVMELLEGYSLKHVVRHQAPIPWRRALIILTQVCEALSEAHAVGVVHRDLKPENIYLVERNGVRDFVKILDFGIAKILSGGGLGQEHATQLTGRGRTVGTVRYMSPEQILGRELDARSDIYTLGVVTYRLLTARMPFPGARKPGVLIAAQLTGAPKPPSAMCARADIPEGMDRLVLRMLGKEPGDRFPDVQALKAECESLLSAAEWDDLSGQSTVPSMPSWMARADHSRADERPRRLPPARVVEPTDEHHLEQEVLNITSETVDETGDTSHPEARGKGRAMSRADTIDETGETAYSRVVEVWGDK